MEDLMNNDDWELQYIRKHKVSPLEYPLDIIKTNEFLNECLSDCKTGMCIGANWHGGATQVEWKNREEYLEMVMLELNNCQ